MIFKKIFYDIKNLIIYKKNENKYFRIFFYENSFIQNHIDPYIYKNKLINKSLIVSLYPIKDEKLKNFSTITFNYLFFIEIFFLILKIKYIYSSTPELGFTAFKKSVFSNSKYIYIQHSTFSLTMIYKKKAFSNFDVVLTNNKFQKKEILELNRIYKCNVKSWKNKYLFKGVKNTKKENIAKKILIAPTWGTDFYKNKYHEIIFKLLKDTGYEIEIRPHYMSYKKKEIKKNDLEKTFRINENSINFDEYLTIITDWSGISIEFTRATYSKSILINSKQKIMNSEFNLVKNQPIEIYSRNILGYEIEVDQLDHINDKIKRVAYEKDSDKKKIIAFFEKNFY